MTKDWTGERLETYVTNETMLEHLHRYAIAMEFAENKNVLDIACGEGYGTWLLSQQAKKITGLDADERTINLAKKKYEKDNIIFVTSSALQIPVEDNSFDLITCFETLEHIGDHHAFLSELKRVLRLDGILIISTPDKKYYSDSSGYKNPYHKKELYEQEFNDLLNHFFTNTVFLKQMSFSGSLIINEQHLSISKIYSGSYTSIKTDSSLTALYMVGIASETELPTAKTSIFRHTETIAQLQFKEGEVVKKTITYRVGKYILAPLKFIRDLFKK